MAFLLILRKAKLSRCAIVTPDADDPSRIRCPSSLCFSFLKLRRCCYLCAVNEDPSASSTRADVLVHVRPLAPTDAAAYRQVRLHALEESPPAFGSLSEDEPALAQTAGRLAASDDRCFFGAFQGGQLVGIVRLSRYEAPNEKHRAYLGGLFVLPAFRRLGYGGALVRAALSRAATLPGLRRINLSVVAEQEAAIRLYRSFGFHLYGTEQETFSRDGRFYDEHLMTLSLSP